MKPGDYCDHHKTRHKFSIYIDCRRCGRETEVERTYPCLTEERESRGFMKRVGCKSCQGSTPLGEEDYYTIGMAFYCEPGKEDIDYKWLPGGRHRTDIVVKNMD